MRDRLNISVKSNAGLRLCVSLCLCIALCLCAFAPAPALAEDGHGGAFSIVATSFPAYDVARQIAGSAAEVTMLLPPGSESHSYEPSPQDVIAIRDANLFIYVGGESDAWLSTLLDSMGEDKPRTFTLMSCVTAVAEESSASMEAEHEHGDEQHEGTSGDDGHLNDDANTNADARVAKAADASNAPAELDEHVWTSPKNMELISAALADTLTALKPDSAEAFASNLAAYTAELQSLDAEFRDIVANGKRDVIVFGDRFPLRYFADEYGLRYDAAFPGCSEDSEPSVKTVMSLVELVRAEKVPVIFYIEFSSRKTADIIAEETGAKEMLFHSCHNVSSEELVSGANYISLMRGNAEALREALR